MAYAVSNPPKLLFGSLAGGLRVWGYKSADADGTVNGAGYITDALELGMQIGDPVFVVDTTTPLTSLCFVLSFTGSAANLAFGAVA